MCGSDRMIDYNDIAVKHLQTLIDNIAAVKIKVFSLEVTDYPYKDKGDYNEIFNEQVASRVFSDTLTYYAIEGVFLND